MTTQGSVVTAPQLSTPGRFYAQLWRRVPRDLGFLLLGFPIALAGFIVSIAMFNFGVATIFPIFIGIFVLIGALYVSRAFGAAELTRLDWARETPIQRVDWQDRRAGGGLWAWIRNVFFNGHYWLALLHTMIVNFAATLFSWIFIVTWVSVGLGGVTYWFWSRFLPAQHQQFYISQWIFSGKFLVTANPLANLVESILYLVLGVLFLLILPLLTRGLTKMHWGIAAGMLGAWKADALRAKVQELREARGAASSAEGHSLRRLERDIHDGPQQRLVRMQMDLAATDRQLADDPEKARTLIAEAMQQSKDALEELRALSRGFAPPILMDRGLVAALESAATRSPIPTRVTDNLPAETAIPQEIERNAYFAASEALTNAIKHSGASDIELRVGRTGDNLVVTVSDNGTGGAKAKAGHGLAGLRERMHGSGGSLEVHSPDGGPTLISVRLPLG